MSDRLIYTLVTVSIIAVVAMIVWACVGTVNADNERHARWERECGDLGAEVFKQGRGADTVCLKDGKIIKVLS